MAPDEKPKESAQHQEEEIDLLDEQYRQDLETPKQWRTWVHILCYPCDRVNRFLDDLVAEKLEIEEFEDIGYSSGDSNASDLIKIETEKEFALMTQEEKNIHSFKIWKRLWKKVRGALTVANSFDKLQNKLLITGTSKKPRFIEGQEKRLPWYLIHPHSYWSKFWQTLNNLMLIYTAIYMPF